jgi:hypothetical protein
VILETFALLRSGPIHEESEGALNHRNGHHHIGRNTQAGHSGERREVNRLALKGRHTAVNDEFGPQHESGFG